MKFRNSLILYLAFLLCFNLSFQSLKANPDTISHTWLDWKQLASLPDSLGFGGAIVGQSNSKLIVAGGSFFEQAVWDGGIKQYSNKIYILDVNAGANPAWKQASDLPLAISNGASVSTPYGIFSLGGMTSEGESDQVFSISLNKSSDEVELHLDFPRLPEKCAYPAAAYLGGYLYVAGGKNTDSPEGMNQFWRLKIDGVSGSASQWEPLPSWPGPARFGAVMISQNNGFKDCIYLFSGKSGTDTYYNDAYQFNPNESDTEKVWTKKADLPRPAMVASAANIGQTHIMLFSGSDGHDVSRIQDIKDDYHFTSEILAYHTITDTWISVGEMPLAMVATGAVAFDKSWIIPGGEIRPGRRSNQVWMAVPGKIDQKSAFHWLDYVSLSAYLIFITWLGFYFSREDDKSTNNYFLGGGKIPFWAAALSIMATSISSIGFMATPSKSFATNWAYFAGSLTMFVVIPIVVFAFIPFFHKLKVVSAYQYLEARFNVVIRLFAAFTYSIFQIAGRTAVVLYLPGIALSAITGMNVYVAIILMGVLSTMYTVLGGMKAVIWTDVFQGFILVGGAILCIVVAFVSIDGSPVDYLNMAFDSGKFYIGSFGDWDYATASLWVVVWGNIFYRLSTYTSDQSIVQRYMVTENLKKAQKASWTSMVLLVVWACVVFSLGTVLYIFYKEHPDKLNPMIHTDGILPLFIAQKMPIGISGLIIAAIFAAAMSSLDSAMHSTSTVIVTDFYKRFFPNVSDLAQLKLAKILIVVFGLIGTVFSMFMVTQNHISIWDVFLEYTGLFGGIVAGLFFLGIFTTRGNSSGAIVGILISIAFLIYVKFYTDLNLLMYGAVSLLACFIFGYLGSLILSGKSETAGLTIFTKED